MNVVETGLPGVVIIEPRVFTDSRGCFMETWHQARYRELGFPTQFVQDNVSFSIRGTLRGLHFQYPKAQGKLMQVLHGEVFDVAVDIRVGSPTFGKWVSVTLSGDNHRQLYVPEGFAHGFCVTSDVAAVSYKCTDFYNPQTERGILWNDPDLGVAWPIPTPFLSPKDMRSPLLRDLPQGWLPRQE
jgi:dTDP-4-dehydrorhamnose 3,5-epimerase